MTRTSTFAARAFLLASAATLFANPAQVFAQTAPAAAAPASADTIVVTARKRVETLISVPVAVSALNADGLAARGIKGFNELNDFVPGLRYENSAANRNDRSFHTITMRGMYPGDSPNRPAATVFIDGVPIPAGSIPGLSDVARVEVVKGPQSAYFGRATFAGALNFITTPPSLTKSKVNITGSMASYGTADLSASFEMPLIEDKLGVRIGGRYFHTNGQYDNVGYGGKLGERNTKSIAGSFYAKPLTGVTLRGYVTYWEDNDGPSAQAVLTEADYNCAPGGNGRKVGGLNYICGGLGSLNLARMSQNTTTNVSLLTGAGSMFLPSDFITSLGLQRKELISNLSGDVELGGGYVLSANGGYNHNRWAALTDTYNRAPDGTGYYSTVFLPYNITNKSAEMRLSSPSGRRLTAMVGTNYYQESIKFQARALRPAAGVPTVTNLSQPTDYQAKTIGLFGSLNYEITDALGISGEARYQWDTIHHVVTNIGATAPTVDLQQTYKSFSPRVVATYKLTHDSNIYASWAKGTRPGVFNSNFLSFTAFQQAQINANAGSTVPVAVPEEKINSYELGFKGQFFDRKLRVLLAAYYAEWRNRQINQNIPYLATPTATTTSTATLVFPAGSTDLWGVELEGSLKVSKALTLDGTFNWAHTKINFTACAECVATNGVLNPVGNLMERYPQYSGSLGVNYTVPLTSFWDFNARADYVYTGKQFATADNITWVNASNKVNLVAGIASKTYKLELFAKNVFDDKVPSNILRNANPNASAAQGANLIVLAAPDRQTFGIRASLNF